MMHGYRRQVVRGRVEQMGLLYASIAEHADFFRLREAPFSQYVVVDAVDRCRVDMHLHPLT